MLTGEISVAFPPHPIPLPQGEREKRGSTQGERRKRRRLTALC